jgi:cytochrome c556
MQKVYARIVIATAALAFAGASLANPVKPEDQIKFRKAGYSFMSWNMGKIKAMTVDAPATYNKDQVLNAARAIAAVANSGMGALYSPESAKDVGLQETRVLPAFFEQPEEVRKVAVDFTKAANELARVAEGGNVNAIKAQFGKTGETCKACHDKFRAK